MPKLSVFTESTKDNKEVRLRLVQSGTTVKLITVDADGDEDNTLLAFGANGSIQRYSGVDEDYGFNLDEDGQLKFEDEL